jgi:hypothetical protein
MPDPPPQRPRRRWFVPRLSIRALIVLVLVLGAGLGYFVLGARDQRDTVAAIRRAGGSVVYSWQWKDGRYDPSGKPILPGWLLDALGPEVFYGVKQVDLRGEQKEGSDDSLMARVGRLRDLERLYLNGRKDVTDAGLAHLRGLTGLRELDLRLTGASGAGLKHLEAMTRLEDLELPFEATRITDAGITGLTGLKSCRQIAIGKTQVSDGGIEAARQ